MPQAISLHEDTIAVLRRNMKPMVDTFDSTIQTMFSNLRAIRDSYLALTAEYEKLKTEVMVDNDRLKADNERLIAEVERLGQEKEEQQQRLNQEKTALQRRCAELEPLQQRCAELEPLQQRCAELEPYAQFERTNFIAQLSDTELDLTNRKIVMVDIGDERWAGKSNIVTWSHLLFELVHRLSEACGAANLPTLASRTAHAVVWGKRIESGFTYDSDLDFSIRLLPPNEAWTCIKELAAALDVVVQIMLDDCEYLRTDTKD